MKRKVIQQGSSGSSTTITLPASWIKKFNIQAGDELEVIEEGSNIIISTEKEVDIPKEIHVDVRGMGAQQLARKIANMYRTGADIIHVTYENMPLISYRSNRGINVRDEIERVVTLECLGMEVEHDTPTLITLKQFGTIREQDFNNSMLQIFKKLKSQVALLVTALEKKDQNILQSMWLSDRQINKFFNFCIRILNKKGMRETKKAMFSYATLLALEEIGDQIYLVAIDIIHYKKRISPKLIKLTNDLITAIDEYSLFYHKNLDSAVSKILRLRDNVWAYKLKNKKLDTPNTILLIRLEVSYDLLVSLLEEKA
ncbi:hypothetical protein COV18_03075 [Candidatus Woesearchaeota archaeon CG10_big_fil_rev_8_21_14_0_10_37_12]|nr:MAG: hypothetical protein COV18_03075 [Candidatus Woesearchaeota archaeon CG10_big_fil_rev_8_21_14_0_10_37_12]